MPRGHFIHLPHSLEHKIKMSQIAKEKGFGKWMKGRKANPATIEAMRLTNLGKHRSAETKKKTGEGNKISIKKLWQNAEHRKRMSLAHLGQKVVHSKETREKISKALKGKKLSEETKKKIGENSKKMWQNTVSREKIVKSRKGYITTEITRKKMSIAHKKRFLGKLLITPINEKIRKSLEYRLWRESVFKRDNYTCIWCKSKGGNGKAVILNADHIKPFSIFPELRFAIDNGRTLCINCHRKTDTWGSRKKT